MKSHFEGRIAVRVYHGLNHLVAFVTLRFRHLELMLRQKNHWTYILQHHEVLQESLFKYIIKDNELAAMRSTSGQI